MNTNNWAEIQKWIESENTRITFASMPTELLSKLDKTTCIKIMSEKLLGYDNRNYKIECLPKHIISNPDVGILAIELFHNNIFELPDLLKLSVNFHKSMSQNPNINYEYIFVH